MSYVLSGSDDGIDAWSVQRLPFEPKGRLLNFRQELREEIRGLRAPAEKILAATYTSESLELVDAENVLIYNVGPGCFAAAASNGLRIERSFLEPTAPLTASEGGTYLHQHTYAFAKPGEPWVGWIEERPLARFGPVGCEPLREMTKVAAIWAAVRGSGTQERLSDSEYEDPFSLRIEVGCPAKVNFAALVKPLVDGVVAAFHSHDSSRADDVADRVAESLRRDPAEVAGLVGDEKQAVLGRRRLLWPWRRTVQWNPADNLAVAVEIVRRPSDEPGWSISGGLHAVISVE